MRQVEFALRHILEGSMLLPEAMEETAAADGTHDVALRERRLARWRDRLGANAAVLNQRIEAAGWSRSAVDAVLSREGSRSAATAPADRPSPAWVRLLRRVLATPPAANPPDYLSSLPFGELLDGFLAVAREALAEGLSPRASTVAAEPARQALERVLAESISEVLSRCLLADFDAQRPPVPQVIRTLLRDSGDAFGDHHYRAFIDRQRADCLRGLLTRYPVAARLAATRVAMWLASSAEFLDRLAADLPEIRRRLPGADKGGSAAVVAVEGRLADVHEQGRSVAIVTFADGGRVVYKPRSLAPEAAWRAFVAAVDPAYAGLAASVIDRGEYGWMEYVARRDLSNREAARAFYRSAGAMLCLARMLAMDDLHFENVVAAGDRPIPVDLETIARPRLHHPAPRTTLERVAMAREAVLEDSVRDTRALPARHSLTDLPPRDISAFADLRRQMRRRPVWRCLGTDAIGRDYEDQAYVASNLPRLNGKVIPPDDYHDEIAAGFDGAWQAVMSASGRLTAAGGVLHRLADVPVRFVHRATEIYYRLLDRALEPEAMRCGIDFSIELEALYRAVYRGGLPKELQPIVEAELRALYRGDIPRFVAMAGGGGILAEGTVVLDHAIARSGIETIRRRLANTAPPQRTAEVRFALASFHAARLESSLPAPDLVTAAGRPPLTAEEAMAAAIEIGREIVDGLIPRTDGGASWIGIALRAETGGPAAVVVNEGLCEGNTGIGIFLAALHRVTDERLWREAAERALVDARRIAREAPADEPIASALGLGLGGIGGLIYGLTIAGDLLSDGSLLADAAALAARIDATAISEQRAASVLDGLAGAIPGLLALSGRGCGEADSAALACARALAARTGACFSWPPSGGFAHGSAGILASLSLLAGSDAAIRSAVEEAMARRGDPHPDQSESVDAATSRKVGWCDGLIGDAVGFLAARRRLGEHGGSPVAAIEHAVDAALADPQTPDQLCCGLFGGVEALLVAARLERPDLADKAGRLAAGVLDRARRGGGFRLFAGLPPTSASPGFLQGISGIGYGLLRIARPAALPSVLLTEWRA